MSWRVSPRAMAMGFIAVGLGISIYAISLPLHAHAQKVGCQSNLRQMGFATRLYVQDYDALLMPSPTWRDGLVPYSKYNHKANFVPVYYCATTSLGYAFNSGLSGSPFALIQSPQALAMFYEPSRAIGSDGGKHWNPNGTHGAGSHVCFLDGHIAWVQTKPKFWAPELARKEELKRRRDAEWQRSLDEDE